MAAYDKYLSEGGGHRALLAADWAAADGVPIAVGLDVSGHIVPGAGNTGILGVVILSDGMNNVSKKAGMVADIMNHGEIVEMTGLTAGTAITALTTTGVIGTAAADGTHTRIGHTVEADRLIVNISG